MSFLCTFCDKRTSLQFGLYVYFLGITYTPGACGPCVCMGYYGAHTGRFRPSINIAYYTTSSGHPFFLEL